tara:strand:- start:8607 stop:9401 length:795 start_codon:yes stop_codon:yes gene_type:complete
MSKGDNTSTVNQDPWDVAVPYMESGFKEAANLYNNNTPQYYSGQTQAGFTPDQLTAQQGIRDFATQGAPSIMNPALSAYQQNLDPSMLDVANNPYVNNMAQAAADRAMSGVQDSLADIRGGAIMSGGYGGGRQGIAEGNAIAGAADAANQAAAQIYSNAYGQGLGQQRATLGMTGGLMQAGFSPYSALSASGGQQQKREQALIQDAMAKQEFEQNLPYQQLKQYQSGITGFSPLVGNAGQSISTTPGASVISNLGGLAQMYSLF